MKLSEALAAAKKARDLHEIECMGFMLCCDYTMKAGDLIDAVEETLMAQKREADILLDLADLRRWGGSE